MTPQSVAYLTGLVRYVQAFPALPFRAFTSAATRLAQVCCSVLGLTQLLSLRSR